MEARFTMTPEAKEFLYGQSGKAEYVVYGPVDIEVELKSGEINRLQEIRERVTRCRDCKFYEEGGCTLLDFAISDMANGFCAWGEPREKQDA